MPNLRCKVTEDGLLQRIGWVASKRHLATVVVVLLAVGIASLVVPRATHSKALEFHPGERLPVYLRVATFEWLLFGYLLFGIRRMGGTAGEVIESSPGGLRRWSSSVGIGIGGDLDDARYGNHCCPSSEYRRPSLCSELSAAQHGREIRVC